MDSVFTDSLAEEKALTSWSCLPRPEFCVELVRMVFTPLPYLPLILDISSSVKDALFFLADD